MRRALAAAVSAALCAAPAAAQDTFGAIAWDNQSGRWGYAYDSPTRSGAERRALSECGVAGCVIRTWFRNACGALVVSGNGHGASWGTTIADAQQKAMTLCRNEGNSNCQLATSNCSSQ